MESNRATINQLLSSESSLKPPSKKPIEKNEMCGLHLCEMAMLIIIDHHTCPRIHDAPFFFLQKQFSIFFLCGLSFFSTNFAFMDPKQKEIVDSDVQHLFLDYRFCTANLPALACKNPSIICSEYFKYLEIPSYFFCRFNSQFFILI